jgi:ubiquinone/menaquinone biosynthesis C-methylase UbiE
MKSNNPIFARLYDWIMQPQDWLGFAEQRARTVARARGRTLELGAGTGLNFRHYPGDVATLTAVEPDALMLAQAVKRSSDAPCRVELVLGCGERLPFEDDTFDTVVATLVFCTIPDVVASLGELERVLRPDGVLHFFEHVRVDSQLGGRLQDTITPIWKRCAGGCHLNRDTLSAFAASGLEIERLWRRGMLVQGSARFVSA